MSATEVVFLLVGTVVAMSGGVIGGVAMATHERGQVLLGLLVVAIGIGISCAGGVA